MEINIKKYSQISYISINEIEKKDIEIGVLDILNYVNILKNITLEESKNTHLIPDQSKYRLPEAQINLHQEDKEIVLKNAPQMIKNYFIVPDLIIRKS